MKTEELQNMINLYFDGELEKNREPLLFSTLSFDEEAREYFKSMNKIKAVLENSMEEFPAVLEERILRSVADKKSVQPFAITGKNVFAFASYAFGVILIFISLFFYSETRDYRRQLETVSGQIIQQNKEIQLLMNGLPASEINTSLENEIIIKANL